MLCLSWEKLKIELDKCDLLCSNCHMEEEERLQVSITVENGYSRLSHKQTSVGSTPTSVTKRG